MFLYRGQNAVQLYRHDREPISLGPPEEWWCRQLWLCSVLEIGDGEHASHSRTCLEQSPTLLALRRESACARARAHAGRR